MAEDVRIWEVRDGDRLVECVKAKLDLEERIEKWLARDVSILSGELLVIGRQVETASGGYIDLLCLDREGNTVIVELKRDRTPREVTAQVLDYASWVKNLSHAEITEIASQYLGDKGPLEEAFKGRFGADLPEVLNESHRMLVVGSDIDPSTERIVKYLSETYGVGINAATFHYYRGPDEQEYLARIFLVQPTEVEAKARAARTSKRLPNLTLEELEALAQRTDVVELYRQLTQELEDFFDQIATRRSAIVFAGRLGDSTKTMVSFLPGESSRDNGLKFIVYTNRVAEYFGMKEEDVVALLPQPKDPWKYYPTAPRDYWGYSGFFRDAGEVLRFVNGLRKAKQNS